VINYNHLYYFHVTATEGSVARAADRLGVGQPTVREPVRQLERTLAVPLVERLGGKLRLTDAGRNAFEHTSVMFRASERLVESLVGAKTPPPVSLRVGMSSAVSRTVATDFLMPVFAIDECIPMIRSGDCAELLRDLRAHDLDLLLSESDPGEAHRAGLQLVRIHQQQLVAVTSSTAEPQRQWEDVAFIHYRPGSVYRFPIDTYLDEHDLHPRIAAETDDALVMMTAVTRGDFTAFVPWGIARDHVSAQRVRVLGRLAPMQAATYALYHDAAGATIARRAVELLVECAHKVESD
jgi:LysR family transcriptional regulator, transcriptional activator of nhaA